MSAIPLLECEVQAAAHGDRAAYARLIDSHRTLVCSIALGIVRDLSTSEDVAQEVFLAVWKGLGRLRNPTSFRPWLRQLTRNQARDVLRRRRSSAAVVADRLDPLLVTAADPRPLAPEQLIATQERQALADALERLPDEAREVLTLYYREGQSVEQVAALLDLREDTVKKRLSRARERLRQDLLVNAAEILARSKPGAAFTAAVLGMLAVGAPAPAAAGGLALGTAAQSGALAKLLAPLGGGLAGALLGAAGVLLPWRLLYRAAQDDAERASLRRFAVATVLGVGLCSLAMPLGYRAARVPGVAAAFIFFATLIELCFWVWLPRILRRRLAAERAADPTAADAQRRYFRRERIRHGVGILVSLATIALLYLRTKS